MSKASPGGEESNGLVEVGRAAPAFALKDQSGRSHRLADYRGKWVVLYFYPKDDTPGCTTEACQFRDLEQKIQAQGAAVLGVSPDDESSHRKFADKFSLPFPLLADPGADVCRRYGVWQEKTNYGRTYMGVVRTTYLIDPKGKVAHRWDKVKADGHAQAVLASLQEKAKGSATP
ncbi:MAG TPA: thioredoxin-dependent thiol peroxidase [Phycisphaeraceae bacterium]